MLTVMTGLISRQRGLEGGTGKPEGDRSGQAQACCGSRSGAESHLRDSSKTWALSQAFVPECDLTRVRGTLEGKIILPDFKQEKQYRNQSKCLQ